jgi:hypothetical protein
VASGSREWPPVETPRARPVARAPELTTAEARVISSLLAADALPERERIRSTGFAPRTYETARRRAFDAGWVCERFVPDPLAWGFSSLRFDLVRPKIGEERAWSDRFAADPRTFHVWLGDGLVFAAALLDAESKTARTETPEPVMDLGRAWRLVVDLRQPTVPIYFDFEGAWSRVVGAAGPRVYPRPLPFWPGGETTSDGGPSGRLRSAAEALVRRPFQGPAEMSAGRHLGSILEFGRPWGAVSAGLVQRRCFLDPARLPGLYGWRLRSLSFVKGTLRTGAQPATLDRELLSDGGMTPFLFATDGKSVLIGALSPAPRPVGTPPRSRISEIFTKRLEPWTLLSAAVSSLSTPLDHRYDRLMTARSA